MIQSFKLSAVAASKGQHNNRWSKRELLPDFPKAFNHLLFFFHLILISCLFSHNQAYCFPQRHLKAARKRFLCPAPLSLNGLVCHSVTEPCSLPLFPSFLTIKLYSKTVSCFGWVLGAASEGGGGLELLLRLLRSASHWHAWIESRGIEGEDAVGGQVTPVSLVLPRPGAAQWHLGHGCHWSCSYSCCFACLLLALSTFKQILLFECHHCHLASPANLSRFAEPKISFRLVFLASRLLNNVSI